MPQSDLVIGAITGYTWDQIKYWANSLDRSGYTGAKAVIAYNIEYETLEELQKRNYAICAFSKDDANRRVTYANKDFAIVVDRFLHYYLMFDNAGNQARFRFVIATDVRDVIFQQNPSLFLDRDDLQDAQLLVSSEGIHYEHEPWGANNLLQSFGPYMYDRHKTNGIVNCGVLAGRFNAFMGLSKLIYLMSHGTVQHVPGGGGPDQAALNLILATELYAIRTKIVRHEDTWAAQLGTTMDPNKLQAYQPFITEPLPRWDAQAGLVVNHEGNPYTIVHQWDRVPEVKEAVERIHA
jgi:hypothetical protein